MVNTEKESFKKEKKGKDLEESKFTLEGIDYLPYILGWIFGIFNIIFWIIILIVGLFTENKHRFIDYTLHRIVYIYGIIVLILILILIFILILFLILGITLFSNLLFL